MISDSARLLSCSKIRTKIINLKSGSWLQASIEQKKAIMIAHYSRQQILRWDFVMPFVGTTFWEHDVKPYWVLPVRDGGRTRAISPEGSRQPEAEEVATGGSSSSAGTTVMMGAVAAVPTLPTLSTSLLLASAAQPPPYFSPHALRTNHIISHPKGVLVS